MSAVNWSEVFKSDTDAVVGFAEKDLTFREFQRSFSGAARKEVNKLAARDANYRRVLARKACRQRKLAVVTN